MGNITNDIETLVVNEKYQEDLKAFTMAAMQGMCANSDLVKKVMEDQDIKNGYEWIATASAKMARATLSELSKQK